MKCLIINTIRHTLAILIACTALAACDYMDHGPTIAHHHALPEPFDTLRVEGMMHVVLFTDTAQFAVVVCPHNLHNRISVVQANGNLHLNNTIAARFLSGYEHVRVELHMPPHTLRDVHLTAPCSLITADTLRSPQFGLVVRTPYVHTDITLITPYAYISSHWTDAHGEFNIAGRAEHTNISMFEGANSFDGRRLVAHTISISHHSLSDALLGPCQVLYAEAHGRGIIYYSGQPQLHIEGDSLHVLPMP